METLRRSILIVTVAVAGVLVVGAINPHLAIDAGPGAFDAAGSEWRHIARILGLASAVLAVGLGSSWAIGKRG